MNGFRHIAIASIGVLLAACGAQPPRPVADGQAEAHKPPPPVQQAPPTAQRRGGYYLDDGPDENPPDNLDRIPDAEPRLESLHKFANNPYSILGKDYVPATGLKPYRARGVASWYGRRFHGQKTSSGEAYDMYAMTAAHPTLPIPSYARVTNVATGKSVVVRVNDRGPFHSSRVMDLSYTAAYKLGYIGQGSALVEVESIIPDAATLAAAPPPQATRAEPGKPASTPASPSAPPSASKPPEPVALAGRESDPIADFVHAQSDDFARSTSLAAAPEARGIFLQLGAFSSNERAESLRARVLRELAWLGEQVLIVVRDGKFRLHVGPYASSQEANRIAERIRAALDMKPMLIQR